MSMRNLMGPSVIALITGIATATHAYGQTQPPKGGSTISSDTGLTAQASPATPQPNPPALGAAQASAITEVVVTAQKRSERINDVPISITAETGVLLAKQGVTNPSDLAMVVPGFTYQKSSFGVPVFTIRGIGLYDTSVGISPTVSVYVDQVPLPYLAMTEGAGLDVARVEVLKGPQGTLFGQNSTGGAINYIAAKPTSEFHAGGSLSYGRFNENAEEGYLSGPLTDTVRARFVLRHEGGDGWQESQSRPGDTLGSKNFTEGRLIVDWDATSRLKFEFNANGWVDHSQTEANQFIRFYPTRPLAAGGVPDAYAALSTLTPASANDRAADWAPGLDYHKHDSLYQLSLRGDYTLNNELTLTSITSYARLEVRDPVDPGGASFADFFATNVANLNTVSQELRLAGEFNRLHFTIGANYERDGIFNAQNIVDKGTNSSVGPLRFEKFSDIASQQVDTYAGFGSVDYKLTSQITLQGGVRYTKQYRDFQGCVADGGDGQLANAFALIPTLAGLPYNPGPPGGCVTFDPATLQRLNVVTKSLDEDNTSWRLGVNWKPTSNTLIYGNITKGYKSGAFTPLPATFSSQLNPVTQESVLAYEVGVKSSFLDRKLDLTAAAFYLDYSNKQILGEQVFPIFGPLPQLINIPSSSVRGGEVELTYHPIRALRLTGGVTYVDSMVDNNYQSFDPVGNALNLKGEAFPNTPKWQAVVDAEYDFPITAGYKGFIGGNSSYRSSSNAAFGGDPDFRFKPYALVNLRAGFSPDNDRWQIQFWARNVFNTYYWTNVSYYVDTIARTAGLPATYGFTISAKY
jgi:iron complex outermembrane receptor protein